MALTRQAILDRIEIICRDFALDSLRPNLEANRSAWQEEGIIDIAVVGQFKAGKSSFLNRLLGRDLLPVGVLPATAVITRMRFGPMERMIVRFLDGRTEEVPLENLPEFVTEGSNPENSKQVFLVDLELPSLEQFHGTRLVDTPGLGSIFIHNTKTSLNWLPRIGLAIMAIGIERPLSENDLELLKELSRHTPEIIILLTKADLVTSDQLAEVMKFTRDLLQKNLKGKFSIFPFSNRPDHETLQRNLRNHLLVNFVGQSGEKCQLILAHKLKSLIQECRQYLDLARQAAGVGQEARRELQDLLSEETRGLDRIKYELLLLSNDLKSQARATASERFREFQEEIRQRLEMELRSRFPEWTGNLLEVSRRFQEWLGPALKIEIEKISFHGEGFLAQFLSETENTFSRQVRAFQDRLAQGISRAFRLSFSGAEIQFSLKPPTHPDIHVGKTFDIPVDLLWFLFPMLIARPLLRRHFFKLLPWEAEKNLARLGVQWGEAVNESIDNLARQSLEFIRSEISTVERLISQAPNECARLEAALKELGSLES